jgi:hypothetical protein
VFHPLRHPGVLEDIMLRTLAPILACSTLVLGACELEVIEGNGELVTREVETDAFSAIRISRGLCAVVTEGELGPVELHGDSNLVERLEVSVDEDGELAVAPFDEEEVLIPSDGCIEVLVSTPTLTSAVASAGSSIVADALVGDELNLEASGGGTLAVSGIDGDALSVTLSGGSQATLSGAVETLRVEASGGSTGSFLELTARGVDVDISGGSHVELVAEEALLGEASGGSTIVVEGDPSVESVDTSGGSSVSES